MESYLKPEDIKQELCGVVIKEEASFELIEEPSCIDGIKEENGIINDIKEEQACFDPTDVQRFTSDILKEDNVIDYVWPEGDLTETDPLALPEIKYEDEFQNTEEEETVASVSLSESSSCKEKKDQKFKNNLCRRKLHFSQINNNIPDSQSSESENEEPSKAKRGRKTNYCFFCQKLVSNFVRHITRAHADNIEVQHLNSLPKRSKDRMELAAQLRNREKKDQKFKNNLCLRKQHFSQDESQNINNVISSTIHSGGTSEKTYPECHTITPSSNSKSTKFFTGGSQNTELINNNIPDSQSSESENEGPSKAKRGRKTNYCFFCQKLVSNFVRHITRAHADNIEVQHLNSLPKQSKDRIELAAQLRNRGNYLFNGDHLESTFVPARRPVNDQSPKKKDFVTCSHCLVFVKRKTFFLHLKVCKKNEKNIIQCKHCEEKVAEGLLSKHLKTCKKITVIENNLQPGKESSKRQKRVLLSNSIFFSCSSGGSEDLQKNILPRMRLDSLTDIVKNDQLILSVGSRLRSNHKEDHLKSHISSQMRDLARIVESMRKGNSHITSLKDCLLSEHIPLLMKSLQDLCGYNEEEGTMKVPSMPARVGATIRLALNIVMNEVRVDENIPYDVKKEIIFNFKTSLSTIETEWRFKLGTKAEKQKRLKRRSAEETNASQFSNKVQENLCISHSQDVIPESFVNHQNICTEDNVCNSNDQVDKNYPDFILDSNYASSEESFFEPTKKKTHVLWTFEQQKTVVLAFKTFMKYKSNPGKKLCEKLIAQDDCLKSRTWQQINIFVDNINRGKKHLLPQLAELINNN